MTVETSGSPSSFRSRAHAPFLGTRRELGGLPYGLMMRMPWSRPVGAIVCLALGGCYAGIEVDAADSSMQTAGGTNGEAGSDDSGGVGETEGDTDPSATCTPDAGKTRLRRLTREQYANAVTDLLGLQGEWAENLEYDEKIGPFSSNYTSPVSGVLVDQYIASAEAIGEAVVANVDTVVSCDPGTSQCVEDTVIRLGRRAYRRPLEQDEQARLVALVEGAETADAGIGLLARALLSSPNFLYHVEVDDGAMATVRDHELAARLSFFLWNSIPDDALLDVADDGSLADPEVRRAQVERMLDDPRSQRALQSFHLQWLGLDGLSSLQKNPEQVPEFETLRDSMHDELARFVDWVINEGDGTLESLLTAPYAFPDAALAELYGLKLPAGHDPSDPLPVEHRAGLLTLPAFLATHAHDAASAPIRRGVMVRSNVLCNPPPPPPPNADTEPPDPDPDATTRELFEQHTADPSCAGCHVYIDGIGLGFEGYDGLGVYRTEENGLPVDESGELVAADVTGSFDGVPELAEMLVRSENVQQCVVRQWFRYSLGRFELDEDACTLEMLDAAFEDADHDIRSILVAIATSDAFTYKRFESGEE